MVLYYEQRCMFGREDLQLAPALADLAALALENSRLRDEAGKIVADAERQRLVHELYDRCCFWLVCSRKSCCGFLPKIRRKG